MSSSTIRSRPAERPLGNGPWHRQRRLRLLGRWLRWLHAGRRRSGRPVLHGRLLGHQGWRDRQAAVGGRAGFRLDDRAVPQRPRARRGSPPSDLGLSRPILSLQKAEPHGSAFCASAWGSVHQVSIQIQGRKPGSADVLVRIVRAMRTRASALPGRHRNGSVNQGALAGSRFSRAACSRLASSLPGFVPAPATASRRAVRAASSWPRRRLTMPT